MVTHIHPEYRHLENFLRAVPIYFDHHSETLHEGRNTVKRFEVQGSQLVVKKFKRPNFLNRVVYTFFRKDKALRAYDYAARLRELGIETPHEVAAIGLSERGLFATGYLVTACSDYRPVSELLSVENLLRDRQQGLAALNAFAAFTISLHEKGVEHLDYNLSNVLFKEEDGAYRFALIDINRMKFHNRQLSHRRCVANLNRLDCDLDVFLHLAKVYAAQRGWNPTRGVLGSVGYKFLFERRKRRRKEIKSWLGIPVPA